MILGNAQADMNMLGWYINILGLVVLVFAIRSSRLCWLASAMIKRRWSSNITSSKLSLRFASCHCQSCSCKLFSKDVSCRWKTSKYEYTQCQQILKYPCSFDWIFTVGLKSLWNILNWGIVTMRRCFTSWTERATGPCKARLGLTIDLLLHFLAHFEARRKEMWFCDASNHFWLTPGLRKSWRMKLNEENPLRDSLRAPKGPSSPPYMPRWYLSHPKFGVQLCEI